MDCAHQKLARDGLHCWSCGSCLPNHWHVGREIEFTNFNGGAVNFINSPVRQEELSFSFGDGKIYK